MTLRPHRLFAFNNRDDVVDRPRRHGRVAEDLATDFHVDAREQYVAHDRVHVVDSRAVSERAAWAVNCVRTGDDEVAIRHSAADGCREVAEGLAQLLFALQGFTSADADGNGYDGGAFREADNVVHTQREYVWVSVRG